MVVGTQAGRLFGRQRERAVLDRLLDTARSGHSAVLVVHGDPGVGKTALLEYAVEAAPDFRVARAIGVGEKWSSRSQRCSSCARRASTS
jgi:hypothetical protein